jgi:hypothetical protein
MPKSHARAIALAASRAIALAAGCALACTVAGPFAATRAEAGTETGFAFLTLPPGVRGAAMGGAATAIADGPGLVFWNPAAAAPPVERTAGGTTGEIGAFHHESILKFRQDVVGGALRKSHDGLAFGFNAHYTEAIEQRDDLGNLLGDFGIDDFAFAAGYGALVGEGLRLGGALQWTRESIAGDAASAFSLAGGMLYAPSPESGKGLVLGLAFKNLGPSPSFKRADGSEGESVSQPFTISAGAGYGGGFGSKGRWLLAADAVKLKGDDAELRAGLEVQPAEAFALRAGYMMGQDAADLTAGAGIAVGSVQFDYAWVPYHDELGASHRFGLGTRF